MGLIDGLGTAAQAWVVVAFFGAVSILGLYIVRRTVPVEVLRENHEVAGFTFGVVGAFYGVVLAFVIVAAWQRFDRADAKAQSEALALSDLYSLSFGFPPSLRSQVVRSVHDYAEQVVYHEWDQMASMTYERSLDGEGTLWHVLLSYEPSNAREQVVLDKSLDAMNQLSDARRLRYVYYNEDLPSVVWIIIYIGAAITIGFSYFFNTRNFRAQAIMCGTFAALIGLTIMAIAELSGPYQGAINVSSAPFVFVLHMIDSDIAHPQRGVPGPGAISTSPAPADK
ncbi:MAG TPA: DUF4239 domain-containing protein [Candidatus Binataceae bacterium]|nr:DUF4239 domain-containing protein [Candidatus Binataceae bacterium]